MGFFALLFGLSILALILGTANELFGLGIWNNDYPTLGTNDNGATGTVPGDYGTFLWQYLLMALGFGVISFVILMIFGDDDE